MAGIPPTGIPFIDGVNKAVVDFYCASLNVTDPIVDPLANLVRVALYPKGPLVAAGTEVVIQTLIALRNAQKRFLCDPDNPTAPLPPEYAPPFSGGQCQTLYRVELAQTRVSNFNSCSLGDLTSFINNVPGPIAGVEIVDGSGAGSGNVIRALNAQSSILSSSSAGPNANCWPVIKSARIISVSRMDLAPDTCGDPPVQLPDGSEPVGAPLDIETEDENGNPITIPDVPFVFFNPTLNLNGDLVFDVEIGGDINICGNFVLSPFGGFTPAPCGGGASPPRSPDTESEGEGTDVPEEELDEKVEEDEVEEDETIEAIVVKTQSDIENFYQSQFPMAEAPVLLVPRVAKVSFKVERELESEVIDGWTDPIDIRSVNAFVPAPKEGRVTNAEVQWEPNWKGKKQNIVGKWPPEAPNNIAPPPA